MYNKFDSKNYRKKDMTLYISESEAKKWYQLQLDVVNRAEKEALGKNGHIDSPVERIVFKRAYDMRRERAAEQLEMIKSLDYAIYAGGDYWLERYHYLKEYKKVAFAISHIFEDEHPITEVAKDILSFSEDVSVNARLKEYLLTHKEEKPVVIEQIEFPEEEMKIEEDPFLLLAR